MGMKTLEINITHPWKKKIKKRSENGIVGKIEFYLILSLLDRESLRGIDRRDR